MPTAFDDDAFEAKVLTHLRSSATGLALVEMGGKYDNRGQWPYAWIRIGDDEAIENDINGQRSFEIPYFIGIADLTRTSVKAVIRKIGLLWYANANALKAELYQYGVQEVSIIARFRPNPAQPETGTVKQEFIGGVQVNFLVNDSYIQ